MVKKFIAYVAIVAVVGSLYNTLAARQPIRVATTNEMVKTGSKEVTIGNSTSVYVEQREIVISPYDPIFQEICWVYGNDWRLMSAIAYHESRFRNDVTSSRGARGMMQIMPNTAKHFGIERDDLSNVETNIMVANMLVNRIEKMLKLPESTPERDRMGLILACYNGGIGYIFNAQKLTRHQGKNPYEWDAVAQNLKQMGCAKFASANGVRHFRGVSQTMAYVGNVLGHYNHYCEIASI